MKPITVFCFSYFISFKISIFLIWTVTFHRIWYICCTDFGKKQHFKQNITEIKYRLLIFHWVLFIGMNLYSFLLWGPKDVIQLLGAIACREWKQKKKIHIISWAQNEHNPWGFMVCFSNLCLNNCPVTNNTVALTN